MNIKLAFSATMLLLLTSFSSQANASIIASVLCSAVNDGFICEARPNSFQDGSDEDTYSFVWTSSIPQPSPTLCDDGPNGQAICFESCFNGRWTGTGEIRVTVTENATGDSDMASKALNCGTGGGGGF